LAASAAANGSRPAGVPVPGAGAPAPPEGAGPCDDGVLPLLRAEHYELRAPARVPLPVAAPA
jgi:hypothetical protein